MRSFIFITISMILFLMLVQSCKIADVNSTSQPVSHERWDNLLKKHVTDEGWVDYRGFQQDSLALQAYLDILRANHPNENNWSNNERLAYWINAYNAFTIELVSQNYPVASIKDIKNGIPFVNTVWDIKFIEIEGETYDLNNIEHGIIRPKFDEPRIHFAINCASVSCPKLRKEAYTADELNLQLEEATMTFINDQNRNKIKSPSEAKVSKLFTWFKGDFTDNGTVIEFINQYSGTKLNADIELDYLDYDWGINGVEENE